MIVQNRVELSQFFNERMNKSYDRLTEEQKLGPDTTLVKTYLLEAHLDEAAKPNLVLKTLERLFSQQDARLIGRVAPAAEPLLYTVTTRYGDDQVQLYFDISNPRFWVLHSVAASTALDPIIQRLATSILLDRVWLGADFLESVSELGSFRGLGLDYDRTAFSSIEMEAHEAALQLKMQLWGNKARDILTMLRDQAFPHETTLSKVKIKFTDLDAHDFTLADVKYDGKVTGRGNSFQTHLALIGRVFNMYQDQIRTLEHNYAIDAHVEGETFSLNGEPILFSFERPIADVENFAEKVFTASPPFRLWGTPVRLTSDYVRVEAVDLHVGQTLTFELLPDFIRLFLPAGTCANTVLRFYTNLQHHYDARVKMIRGDGEALLQHV